MEYQEYKKLYSSLDSAQDVYERIKEGYAPGLVKILFAQKVRRDVKRRFHVVKKKVKRFLKAWEGGTPIVDIASELNFPPFLVAMFLFRECGVTKKKFRRCVKDPYGTLDKNVAKLLEEAIERDLVYSPEANEEGRRRGTYGENLLHQWLDRQGIRYRVEKDLKGIYGKTPDVLLDGTMRYDGKKVCWIESKASFGDNIELRQDSHKQLIPYTEIFGPGIVIYWPGYISNIECPEGVCVCDASITSGALYNSLDLDLTSDSSEESI